MHEGEMTSVFDDAHLHQHVSLEGAFGGSASEVFMRRDSARAPAVSESRATCAVRRLG